MISKKIRQLPAKLLGCSTEEEVKNEFARAFDYRLDTRMRMDLYTPEILFEFKYKRNMTSLEGRSRTIAQALYYVREIKYGNTSFAMPTWLCGIDQDEAFFVETSTYRKIYTSSNTDFDWDRAPSTPCPNIVRAVNDMAQTSRTHVYAFGDLEDYENFQDKLRNYRARQLTLDIDGLDKKQINERSFAAAYTLWDGLFGEYVRNGHKSSEYFMADIQDGRSFQLGPTENIAFQLSAEELIPKPMPMAEYEHYWKTYAKIVDQKTIHGIWQRMDRLTAEDFRRFTGEFYTPVEFASKGIDYLTRTIGKKWWEKGYRLWDMAAGTGNLEYELPEEALPYCYISTLLEDDTKYCSQLFPSATVFQYDYLNDDAWMFNNQGSLQGIPTKMPDQLLRDLVDPEIKWIIFINPPFATANIPRQHSGVNKDGVSMTKIRELMTSRGLGETSRELFAQFLWRIGEEFSGKYAYLGLFSTLKYINSTNDQHLRDRVFHYKFEQGFCFNSRSFHGNRGQFPVGFLVWNMSKNMTLEKQRIVLDIFNEHVEKIGSKTVPSVSREGFLSKWCERPRTDHIMPPLSGAISVAEGRKDVRDKAAPGFLCSLMSLGNDFQHQNYTALLSSPYVSAGAFSVTDENFEKAIITHTVRRLPKATWLNNRDQWMRPNAEELPQTFISDCLVWTLFSGSNNTTSMKNVKYRNTTYQIRNELYPFLLSGIKQWTCSLVPLRDSLSAAKNDRYAAKWLHAHELTAQAREVLTTGKNIYQLFYAKSASLPWPQYKISYWDCGWYQIRMALKQHGDAQELMDKLAAQHQALGEQILPHISRFGFLQGAERYYANEELQPNT
jgi:hypothetical protein